MKGIGKVETMNKIMLDENRFENVERRTTKRVHPECLVLRHGLPEVFEVIFDVKEERAELKANGKTIPLTLEALQVLLHFIWSGDPHNLCITGDHQWQVQDGVKFNLCLDECEELVVSHKDTRIAINVDHLLDFNTDMFYKYI